MSAKDNEKDGVSIKNCKIKATSTKLILLLVIFNICFLNVYKHSYVIEIQETNTFISAEFLLCFNIFLKIQELIMTETKLQKDRQQH